MKKGLLVFAFIFPAFLPATFAQMPSDHSLVEVSKGRAQVQRLQRGCKAHPSSFIIKAFDKQKNGIGDYLLCSDLHNDLPYLHIYLGAKESATDDAKKDPVLVITGASRIRNINTGKMFLAHDRQYSNIWATPIHEPDCCVPFDCDFDYADRYNMKECDLSDCTTGMISASTASGSIRGYQESDCNIFVPHRIIYEAESFIMSAGDIRKYLCKNPEVVYLQFYIGFRPFADELTVFLVGLDSKGHHIWDYNDQSVPYLFGNAVTCPKCTIEYDPSIDFHHQGGKQYGLGLVR